MAYFFACVLEKKEKNYQYSERTLLVIDDPVSSFDADNKAGVISLINMQCDKVLNGNLESKVLVFTHDTTTLRALLDKRSILFRRNKGQTETYLRLSPSQKRRLTEVPTDRVLENMEYYNELQTIFYFADYRNPEEFDTYDSIGNTMRRFAESYANRMFKCQWHELFSSNKRPEGFPEDLWDIISSFAIKDIRTL